MVIRLGNAMTGSYNALLSQPFVKMSVILNYEQKKKKISKDKMLLLKDFLKKGIVLTQCLI